VGRLKVPHMGWNTLAVRQKSNPLLNRVTSADFFYFVHSYYAVPEEKDVVAAETFYGIDFCSAIRRDAIFATQFHPEKSQESGLNLIRNFIRL
jgi:glutamine amidotransferase